jgi:hypothetical protein
MREEPTVLDYVKALLTPWRGAPPAIPPDPAPRTDAERDLLEPDLASLPAKPAASQPAGEKPDRPGQEQPFPSLKQPALPIRWPWRALLALLLALGAQLSFEPSPERSTMPGVALYVLAGILAVWAYWQGEWHLPTAPEVIHRRDPLTVRTMPLIAGMLLAALAFLLFTNNTFTSLNVLLWLASLILMIWAFWLPAEQRAGWLGKLRRLGQAGINLKITPELALIFGSVLLILFYRYYRINSVPPEMVSDQAEKLLDVWDVLHGKHSIFFPRNTGREAFQMYLTAFIAQVFGTGISFLSLKLGTVTAGVLTLPYIYLAGKEIGSPRAGFLAMLFAGIAYWPNTISRIGLRFPLFPLFAAPVLYYLLRGLRRSNRNDFILSGLFLGIGLHGYSPFRIVPLVVLVLVAIYLLHRVSAGTRQKTIYFLLLLVLISTIVFLPLGRYALEEPDMFGYRAFTRLGTEERPLPGPAGVIFLQNLWRAMTMFAWDNGNIWVISVTGRPVLDVVGGALYHLGFLLVLVRYLRKRNWVDLSLLLSIPLLMLPSILSLAFPDENPAINRASGAIIPVFLLAGIALDGLLTGLRQTMNGLPGRWLAYGLAGFLFLWSASQNYDLEFNQFYRQYAQSAWNTSEMGAAIRDFSGLIGSSENAYTVAFPHWVDTRLVGMQAGYPTRDTAISLDQLDGLQDQTQPMLFLVKNDDTEALQTLNQRFPQGWVQEYPSQYQDKNFWMYFVPPR